MIRHYLAVAVVLVSAGITIAQQSAPSTGSGPAAGAPAATAPAARGGRGGRPVDTRPYGPATMPGKGLAEFNFMYAGESAPLKITLVKDGKIDWQYTHPRPARGGGEISDASMLANGNILFAFQYGAAIVSPDKEVIWSVDAAAPTEIHTATMVNDDQVAYIANGTPAKLHVVNIKPTNEKEYSFELPTQNPTSAQSIHGQFRHLRMTPEGHFLVAHMDMNKVVEYDSNGKSVWSVEVPSPWAAARLKNGNTLITGNSNFVREVSTKGDTVWEFRPADVPEIRFWNTQTSV